MRTTYRFQAGFTLIEVMVATSIMMLMGVGGALTFRELNTRQTLVNSGQQVRDAFRTAQQRARAGEMPPGCDQLQAYTVSTPGSSRVELVIAAECTSGTFERQRIRLPNGVQLAQPVNMRMKVLNRGVDQSGPVILTAGNHEFSFQVGAGGIVTSGVLNGEEESVEAHPIPSPTTNTAGTGGTEPNSWWLNQSR
jgi:prepilin-type N-terminal cleavage/methylation domain-containing protein